MSNKHAADWMLILVCAPSQPEEKAGVLLLDHISDELFAQLKLDLNQTDDDIREVWSELGAEMKQKSRDLGGSAAVKWLETTASHAIRISERKPIEIVDAYSTLQRLFVEHVS